MLSSTRHGRRHTRVGQLLTLALALSLGLMVVEQESATAAVPTQSADQLNTAFNAYGNDSGQWSGADGTASVELADGRVAWLFSDTFLGEVADDFSRPKSAPMINNSIVVQDSTGLADTVTGGTDAAPTALLPKTAEGEFFWVGDGTARSGRLLALYNRYAQSGQGALDVALQGTSLAAIDTATMTVNSVTTLPLGSKIAWGSEVMEAGSYTYVYGSEYVASTGMRFAHLARTTPDLGSWQFWNGTGWSTVEADSARLVSGVGTAFGVQEAAGGYVLVTQEANGIFHPAIVGYPAANPWGPFSDPVVLRQTPEPDGPGNIVYDAHVHPHIAPSGKLLISYNVNNLEPDAVYEDARIYRPRFFEATWPAPAPAPGVPGSAPGGLTATPQPDGSVELRWDAVTGATSYWIYQQNVTSGQTHMFRSAKPTSGTSQTLAYLRSGHEYRFAVSAANAAGDGPRSAPISAEVYVDHPDAPTGVSATADDTGGVVVAWNAVPNAWNFEVLYRNVTTDDPEFKPATTVGGSVTQLRVGRLIQGDTYEFKVRTIAAGGTSPDSAVVTAVPDALPPPAPTGVTATATATGSIKLSWTAPREGVWYWVYQRDVTAGEPEFSKLPLPITGTSMEAGYLAHGHQYEYQVTAYDDSGESARSAVVSATATYPAVPRVTGLTATPGNGEVALRWTSLGAGYWYWVYVRDVTAGESTFTQLPYPVTEGTSMTAGYLANGHQYEFRVAGIGPAGTGPQSVGVFATPQVPKPATVTGLTATPKADGSIQLSWNSQGDVYYWIYMRDATAGEAFHKLQYPTDNASFKSTLLKHGHRYEYKVAATNAAGDGPQSAVASAVSNYVRPDAPTNVRARAMGDATIVVDWDGPDDVYYWVYSRDVTAGETSFTKGIYPIAKESVEMGLMKHNHTYEFKVSASNQGGEGPLSAAVRATAYGGLPGAPSNLSAQARDGEVRLAWTGSSSSGVLYQVYQRNATAGQSWQRLPLPVDGTSMTAGYLANGQTYEFKVTAVNSVGESSASNVASARPMPPLPSAPPWLTAGPRDGAVFLDWGASSSPDVMYVVDYRVKGATSWTRMRYPVSGQTSLLVSYLVNGATYEFRVRAANLAGESGASPIASARPMPPFPQPPASLTATPGDGKVVIDWPASPTPNVWYLVEYRATGGSWIKLPYPVANATRLDVAPLANGTRYEFRVRSTNLSGDSAYSPVAAARPMPPLPTAPSSFSVTEKDGGLELKWAGRFYNDWNYAIYYRDRTRQSGFRRIVTGANGWHFLNLPENHVFDVQIAGINMTGEGAKTSLNTWNVTGVSWRYSAYRRPNNDGLGPNLDAWVMSSQADVCREGAWQRICLGWSPAGSRPMTYGDYLFYPRGESSFRAKLRCEAVETAQLADRSGASRAWTHGPHLLEHEEIHSDQWNAGGLGFAADYAFDPMKYERAANLYWGGYERDSGVDWCSY